MYVLDDIRVSLPHKLGNKRSEAKPRLALPK